jgi:Gpi18-like mannosyltransferase
MTATDVRTAPSRRWIDTWRFPLVLFAGIAVALMAVVWLSHEHMKHDNPTQPGDISERGFYGGWMQFDSGWYVYIAQHGYDAHQLEEFKAGRQSAVAYFPGYPLVVRQVAFATGDEVPAAMLTTLAFGLAFALAFWRWCRDKLTPNGRRLAMALVLLYPYAWFLFGSGYADSFFLTATVVAFLFLESDRPVLAGLAGAVATAARPTGIAVVIGLVAVAIARRRTAGESFKPRDAGVFLSLGGLVGYSTFLAARFHDPFAFATVQSAPGWDQASGPHTWFKVAFFGHVVHDSPSFSIRLVLQALFTVAFLGAVVFVVRRFGWGYGAYAFVIIAIPALGTGDFQGMGRYLLAAFPVFALVGDWLADPARRRWRPAVLASSGLLLVVLTSFFARGYYLT